MQTALDQLKPEHFDLWGNGVLKVLDKDVFHAIARGKIPEFADLVATGYPLKIRRTTYGFSHMMWTQNVSEMIWHQLFRCRGSRPSELSADTASIVDPLIREGVLIMVEPASYQGEQDLYWPDDGWFVQHLKAKTTAHMP